MNKILKIIFLISFRSSFKSEIVSNLTTASEILEIMVMTVGLPAQ